jgi:hypothetical protein
MPPRRADADVDIPLILQILRATPNPPNETEDSIRRILEGDDLTYIDTDGPAICRLAKRPDQDFVDIPWWSWLGTDDMEAKLGPVFTAALLAFLRLHGRAALTWGIGGQLSGFGATDDEKRGDADARGEAVRQMMQRDLPVNSVLSTRAQNGKDAFLQSTASLMAQRVGIDIARL